MLKKILILFICTINALSCTKIEPKKDTIPPFITDTIPVDDTDTIPDVLPPTAERTRAIVVGEGQFGYGTGSLTSLSNLGSVTQDIFRRINNRPLGDVPQSLVKIGNYYYIPVNNSKKVEVVDSKTFKSIETMVIDEDVIPMYAVHLGGDSIAVSDQSIRNKFMIMDINHGKERKMVRRYLDLGIQTDRKSVV